MSSRVRTTCRVSVLRARSPFAPRVGMFRVSVKFSSVDGARSILVEALVDTGATLSQLPRSLVEDLGLVPFTRRRFRLADGTLAERDIAPALVTYGDETAHAEVAIGEDAAPIILGVVALETLGYQVDPVRQELVRSPMWLLEAVAGG